MYNFWLLEGPWGPFNDQTGTILFPSYPSTHIYVHVETLYVQIQKYEQNIILFILGGPGGGGGAYVKPKVTVFFLWKYDIMTVQICITRGKNN